MAEAAALQSRLLLPPTEVLGTPVERSGGQADTFRTLGLALCGGVSVLAVAPHSHPLGGPWSTTPWALNSEDSAHMLTVLVGYTIVFSLFLYAFPFFPVEKTL